MARTAMLSELPRWPVAAVPIVGSNRIYEVSRVFCVGRNYEAHIREMDASSREPPFFFTKFPSTVVPSCSRLHYPSATNNFQYEGELVVAIGAEGRSVSVEQAVRLIFGFAAGLDMTRRDLQLAARDKGRPWDAGKNFEGAAPVGDITPIGPLGELPRGRLELCVNGVSKQSAHLAEMIWSVPEIIFHLSILYGLRPGDLIFTGTPAGVGPVIAGDRINLDIEGLRSLNVTIDEPL